MIALFLSCIESCPFTLDSFLLIDLINSEFPIAPKFLVTLTFLDKVAVFVKLFLSTLLLKSGRTEKK